MLISGYRSSHRSRIDYKIFKKVVFAPWPLPLRIFMLRLLGPLARDRVRLEATRRYLAFLWRGRYAAAAPGEPREYLTTELNLAEDLKALAEIGGIGPVRIRWQARAHPQPENPVWTPPLSGFFSTIFAVLCHQLAHRTHAVINDQHWPYAIGLDALIDCPVIRDTAHSGTEAPPNAARDWIINTPSLHEAFAAHTQVGLKRLHERCRALLAQHGIALPEPQRFVVFFIRRGDKLKSESLDIPRAAYLRSMAARQHLPLLAIGDDDFFIEGLKTDIPGLQSFAPFAPIQGSTIGQTVPLERTLAIMLNFCILCEAREVVGDANCNLVAAALAVRGERYSADRQLFPWPRHLVV